MKIILSRKGFDASIGKVASPIFETGELCPLPIPETRPGSGSPRYREIMFDGQSLGKVVHDLARGRITPEMPAHLDPDLNAQSIPRLAGWKPLFGQAGAAERHLQNQDVGEGDVFLFYGWFRRVEARSGVYHYIQGEPDLHVIYGWLQIERRIPVTQKEQIPSWAFYHPHCKRDTSYSHNSLYLAADRLTLSGLQIDMPGASVFPHYHPALCLTNQAPYLSRSMWRLPAWMHPGHETIPLSYHTDLSRWTSREDHTLLRSAGRGQEFVLDCNEYPEAQKWLASLMRN